MISASRLIRSVQCAAHKRVKTRAVPAVLGRICNPTLATTRASIAFVRSSSWSPSPLPPEPTPAENIKYELDYFGIPKWGWAIYRTAYDGPNSDSSWANLRETIESQSAKELSDPDPDNAFPPEVVSALDWVFVSDPETLNGATRYDLRLRFLEWVSMQPPPLPSKYDGEVPGRYLFFLLADEEAMASAVIPGGAPSWVKLVRCDRKRDMMCDFMSLAEMREWCDEPDGDEGWMRVSTRALNAGLFGNLGGGDMQNWYLYYKWHPDVLERDWV
ncbi:hypothetical protein B0T16DRAFT_455654 [Cercophora newfieldiana]|uniref:Uncharacterized protein n=1 Tax=Cercophora newfieldiana TaxID=92897 RepID=A0AA39YA42_9PEZI|nr:hypothetical protein B0T16DRAFT_455654 [Cercophora newfieldiana]